jgi:exopolysaccharide production protein ExoQ
MATPSRIIDRFALPALFIFLMLASGSGLGIVAPTGTGVAAGGLVANLGRVVQLSIFLFFFLWCLKRFPAAFGLLAREHWIAVLGVWIVASAAWSVAPGQTVRYAVPFFGAVLVGLYMAMRVEPLRQIRLLALCLGISAILSLIFGIAFPRIAISPDGEWQGVFLHKNALGYMMCLGFLCFLFLTICERRRRWLSIVMAIICLLLVILSKSAGALAVTALMLLMIAPLRMVIKMPHHKFVAVMTALLSAGAVVGIAILRHPAPIFELLGKDQTLTGRMQLWHYVKLEILARPVLGFGYSAFWGTGEADRIRALVGWNPPTAHNGFLDAALGLGIIGLAILLIGLLRNFILGFKVARREGDFAAIWPLFFMIFAVLDNLTESSITGANACCKPPLQVGASTLLLVLYIANSYWLVRAARQPEMVEEHVSEFENAPDTDPFVFKPAES